MAEADSETLRGAKVVIEILSETDRASNEVLRRDEEFTLWIVGLSTGAIGLVSVVGQFSNLSNWQIFIVFPFFVLAIVLGVVHRWIISRVMRMQRVEFLDRRLKMSTAIATRDEKIMSDIIHELAGREFIVTPWDRWTNRLRVVPAVCFAVGMIFLTVVIGTNLETRPNYPKPQPKQATNS